jgi:hypothetical protein
VSRIVASGAALAAPQRTGGNRRSYNVDTPLATAYNLLCRKHIKDDASESLLDREVCHRGGTHTADLETRRP